MKAKHLIELLQKELDPEMEVNEIIETNGSTLIVNVTDTSAKIIVIPAEMQ